MGAPALEVMAGPRATKTVDIKCMCVLKEKNIYKHKNTNKLDRFTHCED
jgi:hypothetical protein